MINRILFDNKEDAVIFANELIIEGNYKVNIDYKSDLVVFEGKTPKYHNNLIVGTEYRALILSNKILKNTKHTISIDRSKQGEFKIIFHD